MVICVCCIKRRCIIMLYCYKDALIWKRWKDEMYVRYDFQMERRRKGVRLSMVVDIEFEFYIYNNKL